MLSKPSINDTVCYSADFLRSIGDYSYESASLRGKVVSVDTVLPNKYNTGLFLVHVLWCDKEEAQGVLSRNISRVTDKGILE